MFIKHKFLAFVLVALLTLAIAACSTGETGVVEREMAEESIRADSAPYIPPAALQEPVPAMESRPPAAPQPMERADSQYPEVMESAPPAEAPAMAPPHSTPVVVTAARPAMENAVPAESASPPETIAYRSASSAPAVEENAAEPEAAKENVVETIVIPTPSVNSQTGPAGPSGAAGAQGSAGPAGATVGQTTIGRLGPPGTPGSSGEAGPPGPAMTNSGPSSGAPTPAPSTAARGSASGQSQPGATTFQDNPRRPTISTYEDAVSTFSLDTDRTSYRLALNWAREGYEIEPDSVRAEEWINSFGYGYDYPFRTSEFAIHTDVFQHPLEGNRYIARVGIQAPDLQDDSRPLNVTLVLDASGSMADGNRIDIARQAAESIRQSLRSQDSIAVVHFSESVLQGLTVKHTNPEDDSVVRSIQRLQPGGATNVQAGLNLGVQLADDARRRRPDAINYVILMSDGVANVDATNPFAILQTAGDSDNRNPLRLVTIGVGIANYNDYLLEQLAQHGNGWYRYLDDVQQAQITFSEANWLNLATPFADQTRAQVSWDPDMVRTWRIVGYENRVTADEVFTQDRKEFAEIPSGAATTVFYELELTDQVFQRQASSAKFGDIEIRWVEPGSGVSREQYGVVSGHWREDFDAMADPLLKLGLVVALVADRYSGLPYSGYVGYTDVNWELAELQRRLQLLRGQLGHLTAYQDFTLLLDHMTRFVPPEPPRPSESGYSP